MGAVPHSWRQSNQPAPQYSNHWIGHVLAQPGCRQPENRLALLQALGLSRPFNRRHSRVFLLPRQRVVHSAHVDCVDAGNIHSVDMATGGSASSRKFALVGDRLVPVCAGSQPVSTVAPWGANDSQSDGFMPASAYGLSTARFSASSCLSWPAQVGTHEGGVFCIRRRSSCSDTRHSR